jgi:excinuclease ABC subunit A
VAAGTPAQVRATPDSLTAQYLSGRRDIPLPTGRRPGSGAAITIAGPRPTT